MQYITHAVVQFELQRAAPGDASEATPAVQQVNIRVDISTGILPERAEIQISIDATTSTATRKYVVTIVQYKLYKPYKMFNKHPGEPHNCKGCFQ